MTHTKSRQSLFPRPFRGAKLVTLGFSPGFLAVILLLAVCAEGKTREHRYDKDRSHQTARRPSAQEVERKFRPYLEHRIRSAEGGRRSERFHYDSAYPTKDDYYALWRHWDELGAQFRALYKEATNISRFKDFTPFISPKGKFQILYATSGRDSVDVTKTFSYGCSGQQWNVRCPESNGVPDYVNEAAFALDSAYTMLVERFGFHEPLNAPDPNGNTDYYTVVIARQPPRYYGITHLGDKHSTRGWRSYIEINSDWSGYEWAALGYNKRPIDALRVTCAHELFHAVQYAMSWNVTATVWLDNFPYSWTEGSAVLMEDIAFPEVKDYLQYIGYYFIDPSITMLNDDDYNYLNSILFKYLYEKTNITSDISFIKEMYDNNSKVRETPFHSNLEQVAKSQTGKTWAETLNGFHAKSYFTGSRHKDGVFITDSEIMGAWSIPEQSPAQPTKQTVKPYSAKFFWYKPRSHHPNELEFSFNGQADLSMSASGGKTWALSALVMELDRDSSVSVISIPVNQNSEGKFTVKNWHDKKGVLLAATNASPTLQRDITVKIEGVTDPENAPLNIFPNTVSLRAAEPVIKITGAGISDVRIYTMDGKLAGYWNSAAKTAAFTEHKDKGYIEWTPKSSSNRRLSPGTYYITASSNDPVTSKTSSKKTKIMILP